MKFHRLLPLLFCSLLRAQEPVEKAEVKAEIGNEGSKLTIEAHGVKPEPKLFYTVEAESKVAVHPELLKETISLKFKVIQGKPKRLSVLLSGGAAVEQLDGPDVGSWAVRKEGKRRFLDIEPKDEKKGKEFIAFVTLVQKDFDKPARMNLTGVGAGEASSIAVSYQITSFDGMAHRLVTAKNAYPLESEDPKLDRLVSNSLAQLQIDLFRSAAEPGPVELRNLRLQGEINQEEGSARFRLQTTAIVSGKLPVKMNALSGQAAPTAPLVTADYRLILVKGGYQIEFYTEAVHQIDLSFVTPLTTSGDWRGIDFKVPGGAVVPVELTGISNKALFNPVLPVIPAPSSKVMRGFLPASGHLQMAWQPERKTSDGKLFFTSEGMSEISVGAGLLRQVAELKVKTLQGTLPSLSCQLEGAGEILAVEGENVLSWKVSDKKVLEIVLSRPVTNEAVFYVRSQSALEALPVQVSPLRLTPIGAVRHSGYFRIYNSGAVRLEVMKTSGLTQLSPDQYPEAVKLSGDKRQIFYYRYPSAKRSFTVAADRVKPEINVSQLLSYELTETDRVLHADLELDVREAAIREWELQGPGDYSVVAVTGADVADYVASEPENGRRRIKIIFGKEVGGRRLVKLHLEKNEPAQAGDWSLPMLTFTGSESVRGELGVSAAPGYRVSPGANEGLTEMPLNHFPKRGPQLQQAFRIRGDAWDATMVVEALSQNVQADVFHLYSLKENTAYVSILVNYFITGAPVNQWVLALPEGVENLNVDGRDVRDSLVAEGKLTVPLHRPVMGAYQLLVTYEQNADNGLSLGQLTPESVQAERGFIQVVSPGQVELTEESGSKNLVKLDPLELPAEYRLMSHAPSLAAWQYTTRPISVKTSVSWFERGDPARQVVEYADFSSRIERDGGVVTEAIYDVRSRGERRLLLDVPKGLNILEVRVDGEQVTVRESGDQRLIPLPEANGPNKPVRVELRASSASKEGIVTLTTPSVVGATQLMTRWKVLPDTGHLLEPISAVGIERLTEFTKQNGFLWIERNALIPLLLLILVWLAGSLLLRLKSNVSIIGAVLVLIAGIAALNLGGQGMEQKSELPDSLEYSVPVIAPGQALSLVVDHRQGGAISGSHASALGLVLAVIFALSAWQLPSYRKHGLSLAAFALAFGLLARVGGAGWFFVALGIAILVLLGFAICGHWANWRDQLLDYWDGDDDDEGESPENAKPDPEPDPEPEIVLDPDSETKPKPPVKKTAKKSAKKAARKKRAKKKTASSSAILAGLFITFSSSQSEAAIDSLSEVWSIEGRRLESKVTMQLSGKAGERFVFLKSPATLTDFQGAGMRILTENNQYHVVPETDGQFTATFTYQASATDVVKGVPVLSGLAVVRTLEVNYEADGWAIQSPSAVRRQVLASQKGSRAKLWLAPEEKSLVKLSPKARDVASEKTQFYAELDHLFIPGPGVIDGRHRLRIRPSQGQVKQLVVTVPEGFTVSEVKGSQIGPWRFDPENKLLNIEIKPSQSKPFQLLVETQRALATLPSEVTLVPMRVRGSAGEVGMIALAFGGEAQLDRAVAKGLSVVNITDFSGGLIPLDKKKKPTASIQKVYRYAKAAGSLAVKVAPVAPEVRVSSEQRLSIGDERTVLGVDFVAKITRAGVFRLSFPLPAGFEVESLTGGALNHWVEVEEVDQRIVVMNLNGKTIGEQKFSLVLTGVTPAMPVETWTVPKVELRESTRQSGQLLVVPGRGIQLKVDQRQDLSALDPRSIGGNEPGSLAFRLLQKSWTLSLAVDQLESSLAALVLHDVELREGYTRSRIDLRLTIEHASIRNLGIELPGLSNDDVNTVRASGGEVRDIVQLDGGSWQIRFKRRVIGSTSIRIEYEQNGDASLLRTCKIPSLRQQESYLALRPGVRLELVVEQSKEWIPIDWVSLPKSLLQLDRSGAPDKFFRTTQVGGGVKVSLKRHSVMSGSKIRVTSGHLLTVVSPSGELMNQADLELETLQRGSLSVTLPADSRLFGVFVNEESALVVKDGDSYRFHITGDAGGRNAKLRVTYATTAKADSLRNLNLTALKIGEPLENVTWVVAVPEGYRLAGSDGDLDLSERGDNSRTTRKEYLSLVALRETKKKASALGRLGKVSSYLKAGDQGNATATLGQVYNGLALDAATNEDAGIKLEKLMTEQAEVALNTRRQKLYFDNKAQVRQNDETAQIEVAANANPVFTGNLNWGKDDYANVKVGNSAEVNRVLSTIATKWVRHQRGTEPVTQMLDPVIPISGVSVEFTREIQVSGDEALSLQLEIAGEQEKPSFEKRAMLIALILLCILAGIVATSRSAKKA